MRLSAFAAAAAVVVCMSVMVGAATNSEKDISSLR